MKERKREKRSLGIARRAHLPLAGQVRGLITIIQEDRFRLEDGSGRGYLFTLGRRAGIWVDALENWSRERVPVTVEYQGPPDLGAVAHRVTPEWKAVPPPGLRPVRSGGAGEPTG